MSEDPWAARNTSASVAMSGFPARQRMRKNSGPNSGICGAITPALHGNIGTETSRTTAPWPVIANLLRRTGQAEGNHNV